MKALLAPAPRTINVPPCVCVTALQIIKSAVHANKVRRHWDNPWVSNMFGFVPICWIILTVLLQREISNEAYSVLIVRALRTCACSSVRPGRGKKGRGESWGWVGGWRPGRCGQVWLRC